MSEGLGSEELARYVRHLALPEVGLAGQVRLKAARVLLVGTGGLGSPAALYLAAAGVGTLGVVDFDRVEVSNLQRQVLFGSSDVGRPKVEAARERLLGLNPYVEVVPHPERLEAANVEQLVARYDLVVDGSDNAATRYLVNDACVRAGKPDVWGAVQGFEGQVAVFATPGGPCYRCLFPMPPPPGTIPSCSEGGVLGVVPGVVGMLQATEAIKQILGLGEPLAGRLLVFDALKLTFREVRLRRDPDCPRCAAIPEPTMEAKPPMLPFQIEVEELRSWLDEDREIRLLDVREPQEHALCRIEGAQLIPLHEIPSRLDEIDGETTTVIYCHHGGRSAQAVAYLRQQGLEHTVNLAGGIHAWSLRIDPSVPRY